MNLLGAILKTTLLPVTAVVDVATLGGAITGKDQPATVDMLESITDDLSE
jgi:hypothetical protein